MIENNIIPVSKRIYYLIHMPNQQWLDLQSLSALDDMHTSTDRQHFLL